MNETTIWSESMDGMWECAKCDIAWIFEDGGPKENGVKYCPRCGREIAEIVPMQDEEAAEGRV